MKIAFFIIAIFLFLVSNVFTQSLDGYYFRENDYSVYFFENNKVILAKVGFQLKRGLFITGDVKIQNIYDENGSFYGFDLIKNTYGETIKQQKVKIVYYNNAIKIISLSNQTSLYLKRISESDFLNYKHNTGIIPFGLWKRSDDNSVYNFSKNEAILDQLSTNLRRSFLPGETKIRKIKYLGDGVFLAQDKFKTADQKQIWWEKVILVMNRDGNLEIRYHKDNYNQAYYLEPLSF
jgi:hypothetical protein